MWIRIPHLIAACTVPALGWKRFDQGVKTCHGQLSSPAWCLNTAEEDEESTHKVARGSDRDAPDATPQTEKKSDESQQIPDPDKATNGRAKKQKQVFESHRARNQATIGRDHKMRSTGGIGEGCRRLVHHITSFSRHWKRGDQSRRSMYIYTHTCPDRDTADTACTVGDSKRLPRNFPLRMGPGKNHVTQGRRNEGARDRTRNAQHGGVPVAVKKLQSSHEVQNENEEMQWRRSTTRGPINTYTMKEVASSL